MVGISTFGCGRWSEVGNTERKAPDFGLFRGGCLRWFWGVLAGITAGVSFHPLESSRGSAIPQVLQPCQFQQSPDGDMREDLRQQEVNTSEAKMLSSKLPPSIKSEPRSSGHPHSHLRLLNRLLKKVNQLIHNALRRIDRGDHERIWIYTTPVKIVSKATNPLRKKARCALPLPSRNGCNILTV